MRTVLIDFNESVPCKQTIIGYVGEHNATEIVVTPPDILASNEAVTSYIIAFVTGGMIIHSKPFNKAETLAVKLWKQLTLETVMGIQLEAYDDNQNFIGKSEFISGLRFLPSACGDDTVADTDNPDIVSAIAANTSARHSHSNKSVLDRITRANMEDVAANTLARHIHSNTDTLNKLGDSNGSLTYDGKVVGGRQTATVTLDISEAMIDSPMSSSTVIFLGNTNKVPEDSEIVSVELNNGTIDVPNWIDLRNMMAIYPANPYSVMYHKLEYSNSYGSYFLASILFPVTDKNALISALDFSNIPQIRVTYYI